jgi:hypothetical protein
MNPRDDVHSEERLILDGNTVERLLAGRVEPDDAPPGYAEVARVLRAATAPPDPADLCLEIEHVAMAQMLVARRSPASGPIDENSKRMRSKGYRLKVLGLVVVGTVIGTSGLAAAGVLPDSAQDMLSSVLGRVGISVPPSDHPGSSGEGIPKIATKRNSPGADEGAEISETATTTNAGVDKGAEISSTASGGTSQAGKHGAVADGKDVVPVPTPSTGGTNTADAASGGRSDAGTDIADERSAGRSAAGSGNGNSGQGPGRSAAGSGNGNSGQGPGRSAAGSGNGNSGQGP